MARVTLQTIADHVGVSRMTVSNAFSRPDQLSAGLRERILGAARDLGYAGPDPAARALATGSVGAIGILLTDSLRYAFADVVATGFLGAIAEELAPQGVAITLLSSAEHEESVPARDVALDGALVYSCGRTSPAREWLLRRKLPLIYVDEQPVPGATCINVDDRGGARAAAEHVVELGHRRVAIVGLVAEGAWVQEQRFLGWSEALEGAGVEPEVVHAESNDEADAAAAVLPLLERGAGQRPTAVLCFSDVLAVGVARAARSVGLAVPRDLSVVGFDDSPVARVHEPPLTTVRQDVDAKGRMAAAALTAAIERARRGGRGRARHEVLPAELVVRGSTAPAAGRGNRR